MNKILFVLVVFASLMTVGSVWGCCGNVWTQPPPPPPPVPAPGTITPAISLEGQAKDI